mmetsp:Transcript_16875/g.52417  ORF Transcript_16875/g.52417 Transcript_16875/m.52417 type:complete len:209 (-) Transcript_16875:462-1088(-)
MLRKPRTAWFGLSMDVKRSTNSISPSCWITARSRSPLTPGRMRLIDPCWMILDCALAKLSNLNVGSSKKYGSSRNSSSSAFAPTQHSATDPAGTRRRCSGPWLMWLSLSLALPAYSNNDVSNTYGCTRYGSSSACVFAVTLASCPTRTRMMRRLPCWIVWLTSSTMNPFAPPSARNNGSWTTWVPSPSRYGVLPDHTLPTEAWGMFTM